MNAECVINWKGFRECFKIIFITSNCVLVKNWIMVIWEKDFGVAMPFLCLKYALYPHTKYIIETKPCGDYPEY